MLSEEARPARVISPWISMAGLSSAMLLPSLGTSIASVGLPDFAAAFSASLADVQWIILAYLLTTTALVAIVGRLGDQLGRRRLMLAGLILFTGASVLCGAAPALWVLILGRALQGAGAAIMLALTMAFVGEALPKDRAGTAMGLLGTMSATGTALGPTIGGLLLAGFGWQAIFLLFVPLGVATIALAYLVLPADRIKQTQERPRLDYAGAVVLAATLLAYALSMTLGRGEFGPLNISLLAVVALGALLFIAVERRAPSPLIRLSMFADPRLSAGFAMSALVSVVVMTTLVVGPFYLSRSLGLGAAQLGLVMSCGPIVAALTGIPAGRLVDRISSQRVVLLGLALAAAGCSGLPFAAEAYGVIGYALPLAVTTAGYALFQAANNTAVMDGIPADRRGLVSGVLNLSRNLGLITGASAMGALFAYAVPAADLVSASPDAVAAGARITFEAAAALIALAILIAVGSSVLARRGPRLSA